MMCSQTLIYTHVTRSCPVRGNICLAAAASSAGCCGPSASFLDHPLLPISCPGPPKEQVSGSRTARGYIAHSDSPTLPYLTAGFLGHIPAHLIPCPILFPILHVPLNICNKQCDKPWAAHETLTRLQLLADTTKQTQETPLLSPPGKQNCCIFFLECRPWGLGPAPASHSALMVKISFGRTNQEREHPLTVLFLVANITVSQ